MKLRILIPVSLLGAGLVLAACGTSDNNAGNTNQTSTGTGSGAGSGNKPSCSLAPPSMVNAALGTHVDSPKETVSGVVVVCLYSPVPGASGHVTLRMQTRMTAALFKAARDASDANQIPTTTVTGFQDEAYTSTIGTASLKINTLVARKGDVEILVSSQAAVSAEQALEQQLFAALA
jgi:hypothetical protein